MGFQVLLNEAQPLIKDKDEIALIGVENWGAGGFKKNGDFDKAIQCKRIDVQNITFT